MTHSVEIEKHPLKPFLPANAKLLMLGSFPPPKTRWKMDFYYPNFQNDMWKIFGLCFFQDKNEEWNVKIHESKMTLENHSLVTGSLICRKKEMKIAVKDGFIEVISLQFPGKKKMNTGELLNGITFSESAKVV